MEPVYLYDLLKLTAEKFPDKISFRKRNEKNELVGKSFSKLKEEVDALVVGFLKEGVQIGDRITFLCDANPNWIKIDMAIITTGAVVVPRGTDVVDEDITYILSHSESKFAVVQTPKEKERLQKLSSHFPKLEKIWVMEEKNSQVYIGDDGIDFLLSKYSKNPSENSKLVLEHIPKVNAEALSTLIYTSGTTGTPKGVMLSQAGWLSAITKAKKRMELYPEDRSVSLLPPWHAFERAIEYAIVMMGNDFVVSSMNSLKEDLKEFKPTVFPSVPRIWESLYSGIMAKVNKEKLAKRDAFLFALKIGDVWARTHAIVFGYDPQILKPNFLVSFFKRTFAFLFLVLLYPFHLFSKLVFKPIHNALGGELRISISAGSALPRVVDTFLSAIGIKVLEGYGMTETSAVLSIRPSDKPSKLTVGTPVEGYELKIKDEKGNVLQGPGKKGTLWIKSKQILTGYYKKPELNPVIFDADGFFDTGDIMMLTHRGELMFAGRAKDTVVLRGGENVEPVPIEDRLLSSPFVDQVMVVGHDQKTLGALIVPNFEAVQKEISDAPKDFNEWNGNKKVRDLYKKEITSLISKQNGFKSFEQIPGQCFYILPRTFDPDKEMTRTLKMKRNVIADTFQKQIEKMYE